MALTPEHIQAMEVSWEVVCKDLRTNGADLFMTFFTAHPKYQDYFEDFRGIPLQDLRPHKKLRVHGTRVMHALTSMVTSLDEIDVVAGIMVKTVESHHRLGVNTFSQFEDLFNVLPGFLSRHAGDTFNEVAQEGWGIAINVLLSVAKERFDELNTQQPA